MTHSINVFSYSRTSSSSQDIRSQEDQLTRLIDSRDDWNLLEHFRDEAYKGDNFSNRPRFNEMIRRMKNGEASHLVCFSLSRVGRSMSQCVAILCDLVENHHISVYSMSEGIQIDNKSPTGKLVLAVYSSLHELALAGIRESVRSGVKRKMREIKESGQGHWGRPFKSLNVGKMISMRYEEGKSYSEIARALGCGKTTVIRRLREIDKVHKPSKFCPSENQQIQSNQSSKCLVQNDK